MFRTSRITKRAGVLALAAFAALLPLAASANADKTARATAPPLTMKLRDRMREQGKVAPVATKAPARVRETAARLAAEKRAAAFHTRGANAEPARPSVAPAKGAPWTDASPRRPSLPAARGISFEGRNGTGLGDIFEDEPNDSVANILDDIPVNVVGEVSFTDDIDFFAITAVQGESIRIEVIADRIFASDLDSLLFVIADDGETTLAQNDDFFDASRDSFIRFIAPDPGNRIYFIGVTDFGGFGGSTFDYVLNLSVADAPDRVEVEPNDTTNFADEIPIPGFLFGGSDAIDDLDVFVISGFAGEALIVDVDAELFFSDMDPVVELFDDVGGYLFGVDDADGLDPRFNIVLPYTGTFYLGVYDALGRGGPTFYYSIGVSTQSGTLAPRITGFKFKNFNELKQITGFGFVPTNGGSFAELNSAAISSFNAPAKPTTAIKVRPRAVVRDGDVLTVVNPDGRRSNPGVVD